MTVAFKAGGLIQCFDTKFFHMSTGSERSTSLLRSTLWTERTFSLRTRDMYGLEEVSAAARAERHSLRNTRDRLNEFPALLLGTQRPFFYRSPEYRFNLSVPPFYDPRRRSPRNVPWL